MPFKSKAQERFAYANPSKFGGKSGLAEWSSATDQSKLPERKGTLAKALSGKKKKVK